MHALSSRPWASSARNWLWEGVRREGSEVGGVATSRVQAFVRGRKMAAALTPIGCRGAGRSFRGPARQPPSACKHMEPPSCNLHASGQQTGGWEGGSVRVGEREVRALYLLACLPASPLSLSISPSHALPVRPASAKPPRSAALHTSHPPVR